MPCQDTRIFLGTGALSLCHSANGKPLLLVLVLPCLLWPFLCPLLPFTNSNLAVLWSAFFDVHLGNPFKFWIDVHYHKHTHKSSEVLYCILSTFIEHTHPNDLSVARGSAAFLGATEVSSGHSAHPRASSPTTLAFTTTPRNQVVRASCA
ncbi:hypothetical protein C8Q74DRAFT_603427 [Fomes fomentarius]|nr:hypothetical protein C8Q74DRAFT_603427 [Fomes fomentarius]